MIGPCVLSWSRAASPVPPRRWGPAGELCVSDTASRLRSMWWRCRTAGSSRSWTTPIFPCSLLHVTATENRGGRGDKNLQYWFSRLEKYFVFTSDWFDFFQVDVIDVWSAVCWKRPNRRFVLTCGVQTQTKTTQMINRDRGTKTHV